MSEEAIRYDASCIKVLEGLEAIRRRPGMYAGSVGERGLRQLVFEATDPAVAEILAGRATRVDVTLTADGGVRVADDGPGVPVEAAGHVGSPGLESLLTRPVTGADPGGRHSVTSGFVGVGPCVTNALSSSLRAEVRREGVRWVQEYVHGAAVSAPVTAGPATGSGTTLVFRPDDTIFETTEFSFTALAERFRELAFLNRSLDISLTDERTSGEPRSVRWRFPDGVAEFVAFLDAEAGPPLHPDVIRFEREDPKAAGTVEVGLRWRGSGQERIRSYANSRPTPDGGTHTEGFLGGVAAALNAYARKQRLLPPADPGLSTEQICAGLTAVVSVKVDEPEFLGATSGALGNVTVRSAVEEAVREHLGRWLEEQPEWAAAVVGRLL
ncbi:DNA gyrase subunit B [Streptomyces sp. NPDC058307]|uniref:DNA gyrase subunit B n=1 Tax=Streptomyces sp. NPDC058307 TaxID=3346439 RepID=UPI0036ED81CC